MFVRVSSRRRSLFPGAHVGVDGHAVISSVTQLLLANLCTAGTTTAEKKDGIEKRNVRVNTNTFSFINAQTSSGDPLSIRQRVRENL